MHLLLFNLIFVIMSRNKVFERAKVTAPSGRNPFDLSQAIACTSLAGELNVVMAQPVIAGTKGKISRRCFTRTADVVSPAFHRVTEHFDFFMVPIHSMWRMWNDWKPNINDMKDTNLVAWDSTNSEPILALPSNCPRLDFLDLVNTAGFQPASGPIASDARVSNDCLKLCESLGYGEASAFAPNTVVTARVMNVFKAGAYQKVYFEHYRNTAYESNNPYAYNFDWLYNSGTGLFNVANPKDARIVREMFKMRRVNYRNDYFHNIYPALNYVSSDPSGISGFSVPSEVWLLGNKPSIYGGTTGHVVPSSSTTVSTPSGTAIVNSVFSVQNIRAAFALDKLMRASAYAPKHVREQWKAQFGVDTVDDPDMRSVRIGSFQSDITFQEVTNMASTASNPLGELGAKGLGSDGKDRFINFFAKEDSIIIGVHYYLPRAMYDAYGLDPFNIHIERNQFFNKFFENLGLRPFYLYYADGTTYRLATQGFNGAMVLGWTVPNFEKKCQPDLNYGPFKEQFCEYRFVPASAQTNAYIQDITNSTSKLSTFVPHNNAYKVLKSNSGVVNAEYFKVAPEDLDNVFLNKVPSDHRVSFFQFYGAYRIAFVIVAGMSVHGQPSL